MTPDWLPLLLSVCVLGLLTSGLFILVHEGYSRAGWLHFFSCASFAGWEACLCAGFLIDDVTRKEVWLRIGTFCAVFLPAIVLHMDAALGGKLHSRRFHVVAVWLACIGLAVAMPGNFVIEGVHKFSWGYMPQFGILGWVYTFLLVQSISTGARIYGELKHSGHPESATARRGRLLLRGLIVGSFGAVDLLPLFGVDVYPLGGIPMLGMTLIDLYATWRVRLIEITPEFASQQLMNTISDGVLVLDQDGIVRLVNPAAYAILGCSTTGLLHRPPAADMAHSLFGWNEVPYFPRANVTRKDCVYVRADGQKICLNVSIAMMREGTASPVAAVITLHDVTASRAAQDEIRRLAYYDPLTGLANRVLFRDRAEQAFARAQRDKTLVALLFLDLDRFKTINDSVGHPAADTLLCEIASRLLAGVRATDIVSRQGGDEFLILLTGLHHPDEVTHIAQKILQTVSSPFQVGRCSITPSFSIGIGLYPTHAGSFSALLSCADTALYHAKESGRNTHRFFTEEMDVSNLERLELEGHLRHAIELGQLYLHYQPQVDLYTGQVCGAEALLRWNHPELGEISPARFIPVAEDCGLIIQIGAWVIHEVCRQMRTWRNEGVPGMRIAVNLSTVQFRRDDIALVVQTALQSNGVEPSMLEMEITESVLLYESPDVERNLRALKQLGVRLAIDDFGAGYSSFAYLKKFQVDKLKIDRSFIQDIPGDTENAAIVRAIVQLGHSLNLTIVAEGVETHAQASFLRECGCEVAQGFLFGRPMRPQRVPELHAKQAAVANRFPIPVGDCRAALDSFARVPDSGECIAG